MLHGAGAEEGKVAEGRLSQGSLGAVYGEEEFRQRLTPFWGKFWWFFGVFGVGVSAGNSRIQASGRLRVGVLRIVAIVGEIRHLRSVQRPRQKRFGQVRAGVFGDPNGRRQFDAGDQDLVVAGSAAFGRYDAGVVFCCHFVDYADKTARVHVPIRVCSFSPRVSLGRWLGSRRWKMGRIDRRDRNHWWLLGQLPQSDVGEAGLQIRNTGQVEGQTDRRRRDVDLAEGTDLAHAEEGFGAHVGAIGKVEDGAG